MDCLENWCARSTEDRKGPLKVSGRETASLQGCEALNLWGFKNGVQKVSNELLLKLVCM